MNRLKYLREERKLTQEELAFQLDTSQQRISKIERGLVPMSEKMIRDCTGFFSVTADYLLGISDIQVEIMVSTYGLDRQLNDSSRDFLYYYMSCDRNGRRLLKGIAELLAEHFHDKDSGQQETV